MRGVLKVLVVAGALALVLAPAAADAEGYFSPWASTQAGSSFNNGRAGLGFDAGGMGAGIMGGVVDFGWSPSFFGTQHDFGNNSVINLRGDLIVGVPIGGTPGAGARRVAASGVGLWRTRIGGGTMA